MEYRPTLEEARRIAREGTYKVLPVSCEILADLCTPIEVMQKLKNVSNHCYMLESVEDRTKWGRYTFLGFDPKLEVTCSGGDMKVGNIHVKTEDPASYIRQILADYRSPTFDYLPSFTGGLVGYFSYDFLGYSEPKVRMDVEDSEQFKDVDLMLFDKVIAFDNFRQKIILICNMPLEDPDSGYNKAKLELQQLADLLKYGEKKQEPGGRLLGDVRPLFDKDRYCEMVRTAQKYIYEGDIFQVVLSNRLEAPFEGSLLNTYRILRTLNPSPYMFYFSGTDVEVAGASPETLVKLEGGVLHVPPRRDPAEREDGGGGPRPGAGPPGGRKGTGGAQHARGPRAQRPRKGLVLRDGAGGKAPLHRAVLPRHAHRVHGPRGDPRRQGRPGRRGGGPAGGHPVGGTEDPRLPDHR